MANINCFQVILMNYINSLVENILKIAAIVKFSNIMFRGNMYTIHDPINDVTILQFMASWNIM